MRNEVLVLGDEKGARRQGTAALREPEGDAVSVADSILVEVTGTGTIDVSVGSGQPADDTDLDVEVHAKQPTINREKVAVSVLFTEAGATQVITVAGYVQKFETSTVEFLFAEEQTATALSSRKNGKFVANPLEFPTRGATLFEVRRAAPSAGQTEVRAWPF